MKKRLLYVDDDFLALDSIKKLMKDLYEIDIAENSERALELVKKNKYDAILMDIGLGLGTNGIELTNEIRNLNSYYKDIPFIALTAFASRRDKNYFLSHGLDYYISKPFFKNDLVKLLAEVFHEDNDSITSSYAY